MKIVKLTDVDPNFKSCSVEGVSYDMYNPRTLGLEGFPWEAENERPYIRMPERIYPEITPYLQYHTTCSAGGCVRFCTDATAILIRGTYRPVGVMSHMALSGQAGFDVLLRENGYDRLLANFRNDAEEFYKQNFDFSFSCPLPGGMQEYRINLPLYSGLERLEIGISQGAKVTKAPAHKVEKPILFYGSSITQGGCASRPSTCHAALLSSWVDAEQINMGYSGNAKGEPVVAEEIAKLDLSCFVMDYDFNADTPEYLAQTHEPFFRIIREKNPDLPVIFISRPHGKSDDLAEAEQRRAIIYKTYENAKNSGDNKVFFVDGMSFFAEVGREVPTVDRVHPTDLGFYLMAKGILPALKEALGL